MERRLLLLFATCFSACEDDSLPVGGAGAGGASEGGAPTAGGPAAGGGGADAGGGPAGGAASCFDDGGPADKARFVVVGHPYDDAVDADGSYEVLALSSAGELSQTGHVFHMGRPADRPIVFTPSGEVGFAVQDDGTVGVFRLASDGAATVISEGLAGDFYADSLRWMPSGEGFFVVDGNFPKNGGGLYPVGVGCDVSLTAESRVLDSKNARDVFFDEETGDALLCARGALGSTEVAHVHRISLGTTPELVASKDAFGDDEAITSFAARTKNGKHLILGDNSAFSAVPNRVAAVEVTATGLGAVQTLTGVDDPYSIAVSPFDDAVVVTSGFGDGIFVFDYDAAAAAPLTLRGELDYVGASPQLPGALATVERGPLDGRVLIADVRGVYAVQFAANAQVEDLGVFELAPDVAGIVVGIGVQP